MPEGRWKCSCIKGLCLPLTELCEPGILQLCQEELTCEMKGMNLLLPGFRTYHKQGLLGLGNQWNKENPKQKLVQTEW